MKITPLEQIVILLAAVVLAFSGGYYYRGTTMRDAIVIQTEKTPPSSAVSPEISPSSTPAPTAEPSAAASALPSPSANSDGRIDLNTATAQELESLPGIGPALAQRILDYRESVGGFASVDEILYVSGIGEKTYAKIADYLKVEGSP